MSKTIDDLSESPAYQHPVTPARDCDRWRDCDGEEQPRLGQRIRTWDEDLPANKERSRQYRGNWWTGETHWRPQAEGPEVDQ